MTRPDLSALIIEQLRKDQKVHLGVNGPAIRSAIEKVLKREDHTVSYHRPVCAACQVEMHPERSGVGILDMADYGPVELWDADLWECPKCGFQIVSGFGNKPISRHYEGETFERLVKSYNENSIVIESR